MFRLLAAVLLLILSHPALAQLGGGTGETHIRAALIAESEDPAPGKRATLAIAMTPAAGWHGYWKNPGDSGMETRAEWTVPEGVHVGDLSYPVPHRLVIAGLMNYVYEGPYAQLVELTLPPDMAPGTPVPVRLKLDWLACTDEICVPESTELAIDLVAGDGAVLGPRQAEFDRYRATLPRPLGATAHFARDGGKLRLGVPLPAATAIDDDAYFYPLTDGAIDYAAPQAISRSADTLVIEAKAASGTPGRIAGVLRIGENLGLALDAEPGAVPAAGDAVSADATAGGLAGLPVAFAFAVLGGLLLNVMPCVFPILSLKALSLAQAGASESGARRDAMAYTGGAVIACMALGATILVLRAGGDAAGWAFQLQNPHIIMVLLLLVTAIAFNLAGLFDFRAITAGQGLATRGGWSGSFWTGALAAFVATPCTGPFMGVALGAALLLPAPAALAVFAGLGLGLALPFLLVGFVPALRRRLPKPGAWMEKLRRILSIPMFATALALAWILGRQAGVDAMTLGLAGAGVLAIGLWWFGVRQARGRSAAWTPVIPALALAFATLVILPRGDAASARTPEALGGEAFSEARLAALRAENKPVFLYFTADWCITCKANEKVAIQREEVAQAFARKGVVVMVGDWTNGDPGISRFLARHGRSGVPLYLFYRPGEEAETLPQVLTPGRLTALAG